MPQRKSVARSITAARGSNARTTMHRQQHIRSNTYEATHTKQRQDRKRSSRNGMACIATPGSCRAEDDSRILATREHALEAESTKCRSSTKHQSKLRSRSGLTSRTEEAGFANRAQKQGSGAEPTSKAQAAMMRPTENTRGSREVILAPRTGLEPVTQ